MVTAHACERVTVPFLGMNKLPSPSVGKMGETDWRRRRRIGALPGSHAGAGGADGEPRAEVVRLTGGLDLDRLTALGGLRGWGGGGLSGRAGKHWRRGKQNLSLHQR